MASSRKRIRADLASRARQWIEKHFPAGGRICVGFSGGIDSVALLDVLARLRSALPIELSAIHVNHGISPNAAEWARFCRRFAQRRRVPLEVVSVDVESRRALGVEGAARLARYTAFARQPVDAIALAHQRDDQAETVLLQLLRGAGARGLAGMGEIRHEWPIGSVPALADRLREPALPSIVRPLLGAARADIEAYARSRRLRWIHDETNDDEQYARNFVRRRVMPLLVSLQPAASANLARSARLLAESARMLHALGQIDLAAARTSDGISIVRLIELGYERARNALRVLLEQEGLPIPDADGMDDVLRQLVAAKPGAQPEIHLGGAMMRRFRGAIRIVPVVPSRAPNSREAFHWRGERPWRLPDLRGELRFERSTGRGIAARFVRVGLLSARLRKGGERLRSSPSGPSKTLKNLFQESTVPAWERANWPLIFVGERMACVPGIGVDEAFSARPGERGEVLTWYGGLDALAT